MLITVENVGFVLAKPQPGYRDSLVAVFDSVFGEAPVTVKVQGCRYFESPEGKGYVMPPQIKADKAVVRPVKFTPEISQEILALFEVAWDEIVRARKVPV